jgi:hypothetical protein
MFGNFAHKTGVCPFGFDFLTPGDRLRKKIEK